MKQITAREFQHAFGTVSSQLKPGETVAVTKHGKPHGFYQRAPKREVKRRDFLRRVEAHPYSAKAGDALIAMLYEAVS